jgi:hypothetical protein
MMIHVAPELLFHGRGAVSLRGITPLFAGFEFSVKSPKVRTGKEVRFGTQ